MSTILNGCTTTRIFCRPNCPPGRRTKPSNRVMFATKEEAVAAGYRSCRVCLPTEGGVGSMEAKDSALIHHWHRHSDGGNREPRAVAFAREVFPQTQVLRPKAVDRTVRELDVDLSGKYGQPAPLWGRMEVGELPGLRDLQGATQTPSSTTPPWGHSGSRDSM